MRVVGLSLAVLTVTALPVLAAPGDQWILGIHHFDQGPSFTESVGAGYSGPHSSGDPNYFGNSYAHSGTAGDIARVYWALEGNSLLPDDYPGDYNHDRSVDAADYAVWRETEINGQAGYDTWLDHFGDTGNPVPTTTELYTIEYFQTAQPNGHDDFQVIESRFHGEGDSEHGGELYPYDDHIPWAGAFGTNHQWISLDAGIAPGEWNTTGPGPNTPSSASFNASPFGEYMWLTEGSWVYAKWDFGFEINRSWSALRLTQVTENGQILSGSGSAVPEPAGAILLMIGLTTIACYVLDRRGRPSVAVVRVCRAQNWRE